MNYYCVALTYTQYPDTIHVIIVMRTSQQTKTIDNWAPLHRAPRIFLNIQNISNERVRGV